MHWESDLSHKRRRMHCGSVIASVARQSVQSEVMDCHVAMLLAMTISVAYRPMAGHSSPISQIPQQSKAKPEPCLVPRRKASNLKNVIANA